MKVMILAASALVLAACATEPAPPPQARNTVADPAKSNSADPAKLDIANVELGMEAGQVMAALRKTYGESVMDLQVDDRATLDVVRITKDMNLPANKIYRSVKRPTDADPTSYINHIFYTIEDPYVGRSSVIIDLAKAPGQADGPAKVYQVLQVTRGGAGRGPVFQEISERVGMKYGLPTEGNQWCAQPAEGKCPADKPRLSLYLIKEPVQSIKSVLQLYDPAYGTVGPEAIGAKDTGTLSFGLHT